MIRVLRRLTKELQDKPVATPLETDLSSLWRGGNGVFIHITQVIRSGLEDLRAGERVSYRLTKDPKNGKPSATDLQLEA
jgi:cold shock CspA family protein